MEYRERIPVKKYRPMFGYGYHPEEERRIKKEALRQADGRDTMPAPAESPLVTLIAVIVLWLAFLIGAIVATRLENSNVTWQGTPAQMQAMRDDAGGAGGVI